MTSALDRALIRSRAVQNTAAAYAMQLKKAGSLPAIFDSPGMGGYGQFAQFSDQSQNKQRYAQFRGWVYSAVNALAIEGAGQPFKIGRMAKEGSKPKETKSTDSEIWYPGKRIKSHQINKMPAYLQHKAADANLELIPDHPLMDIMNKPNSMQHGFQFVYSFVANLCMTGWGYIIGGVTEDGQPEFYSVPTTWMVPDHSKGMFQQFRIINPRNPSAGADQEPLDRSQVTFAYLPNPADPMMAMAPAGAQGLAVKIDDQIQSSQAVFFENSVFPGAIVTMGMNPHPDAPGGGVRPRLTPAQRRQVYAAIKKVMGGVANYGNPAIIDGMIEKIERLSASQNEIGWEKSEKAVRTRILSAFSVHPFILGEEMAGSYAQAYVVGERFCKRVNVFLALLSAIMTDFVPKVVKESKAAKSVPKEDKLLVWWEEASVKDISMEKSLWEGARGRDDVTQNEFRAYMGLPPDEDKNESVINKSSTQAVAAIAAQVKAGALDPEQAVAIFEGMGMPSDVAKKIAGKAPPAPEEEDTGGWGGEDDWGGGQEEEDPKALQGAEQDFGKAVKRLTAVESIIEQSKGLLVE